MLLLESLPIEKDLDFLVVAGDLFVVKSQKPATMQAMIATLSEMARHVLYVTGNHEYYGGTKRETEFVLKSYFLKHPNFHWLNNEELTLDGVQFVGGTMWYPRGDGLNQLYERQVADRGCIKEFNFAETENMVFNELVNRVAKPETVVITHHMPHRLCVPEEFKGSQTNRFFVSDQTRTLMVNQPRLWLFGHTHKACDVTFENSRLLCNPLGYPRENKGPYPQVVVNV